MSRMRIIGPIFFTDALNAERCRTHILEPFLGHLAEREIEEAWLKQDGATAHTASSSLQFLADIFGNRIISRGIWPAPSPDLTPPDYYLWGALKGKVYENSPNTVDELKAAITTHIQQIPPDTLLKVFDNMKKRVQTSSGPWGTFATSAVGRTATWYVELYCAVTFGTLCMYMQYKHVHTSIHARVMYAKADVSY
jgi:hypothetical protein